ncbi:2-polyprenyl-6-methoxyphenol hydroxylase-like FAD-dependent oxidoreductase [Nonomuraea thailandensis]|uniref:2-polyprenyl-6-methoxyphenol hydroxylase-like FAD-dependent oxidoreductase n=1 Tax=Nonomuraea thailandensis TaxID=1188745 RepID=A0A9X2G7U8_9ACTN|nr:FAD-dependent monooxygenase [Nonomuraea thailandensis]MCP2353871.1 2-polyprenyl-6-methoxyphenol hydroxylase-like FAD-dependent oxidoreductase [Nonomuraea thailandensis]
MRDLTVLISGAGIAGPALAHWLTRHNNHPTIIERAQTIRPGGQAVDFRGAPQLEVLTRMGILDAIRQAQTHMGDIKIVDGHGRRLSSLPSAAFSGEVEILRGDLSRILHDAAPAEYLFGDSITTLTETAHGVHVTFERSAPRTFDLVVGADGIRSKIRELAFGDTPAQTRHLGMYGAIFSVPGTYGLDHEGVMYSEPARCATIVSTGGRTRAALDFAAPPLTYDHRDRARQQALVEEAFAGAGWEVPRLLRQMREAGDFYFAPAAQIVLPAYSSGRVALLGDAGHAPGPGGMGTGLALIGAYVLAGELAEADDHETAFSRYESRMRPYVTTCQRQARGADTFLVPRKKSQIWRRNQMMRLLPYMPGKSLIKRMTERAASAIDLRSYATP